MYSKKIDNLCNEVQRLLDFTITKLKEAENIPDILQQEKISTQELDFSIEGIKKQIEVLAGEQQKLTNKEMVLAVVGTMKAGKSTTINAIVGTEVLPNRNRPMTALPTLIRHKPGQKEPILYFPHTAPINALMKTLQQEQKNKEPGYLEQYIEIDEDMQVLLNQIEANNPFEQQYHGTEEIFNFLKSLNDLVRLSAALEIAFPFNEYATIGHIPSIDIEFIHLKEAGEGYGQLTLMDTPGPNEAGQQHLRAMLKDQLNKASAVLVVLDYGQLKSISDEDVRRCVSVVRKNVPLYALVNQFDRRDRNSDGEEQVKNLVSDQLLKGIITKENVFPVSSLWAYLANRVRHEISLYKKLPPLSMDNNSYTWIDDFANLVLRPTDGPEILENTELSLEFADAIWKKSLFSYPIENIIKSAYEKAALISLQAASTKLLDYVRNTKEYFQMKDEGLYTRIEVLNESVLTLKKDIDLLKDTKEDIKLMISNEIRLANKKARDFTNDISRQTACDIDFYFKQGKLDEKIRNEIERRSSKSKKSKAIGNVLSNTLGTFMGTDRGKSEYSRNTNANRDFDPNKDEIKFDNSVEAEKFIRNISDKVGDVLDSRREQIVSVLDDLLQTLEKKLTETITNSIKPIEERVQNELNEAGFTVSLSFPTLNSQRLNFSANSVFNNAVVKKQESVTRRYRTSGLWGTVCGWLNTDDWGWEERRENAERYVITLSKLKSNMQGQIANLSSALELAITEQINNPVSRTMINFFIEFSDKLESIRSNFDQSALLQRQKKDSLEQIKQQAGLFFSTYKKILSDSEELKKDVDQLGEQKNGKIDVAE